MNFLQRIKDGAGKASERAQSAVEIGRLNSHISDIQREIEVHYLRMGQVFYESYSNRNTAPAEEEIMELCTACDLLTEEIAELRSRIADLRNEQLCECGARLAADAASCPHCGRQLAPEAETSAPETAGSVELSKEPKAESRVEAEAVHDLVGEPGFEVEDRSEAPFYDSALPVDEEEEDRPERGAYRYEEEAYRQEPNRDAPVVDERSFDEAEHEDEQFETKRFELGQPDADGRSADRETNGHDEEAEEETYVYVPSSGEKISAGEEETPEQRDERQRRELREIRTRERRKMQEARRQEDVIAAEPNREAEGYEEEAQPEPVVDPEHERRQRERIEREKERQDELDRLIASWNRGNESTNEDEHVVRRAVGEVVRCQVCGSGLPKGSKWCPHCASEQI